MTHRRPPRSEPERTITTYPQLEARASRYFRIAPAVLSSPTTLKLQGELDVAAGGDLRRALEAAASTTDHIVVDLHALTFVDAAGLRPLVEANTILRRRSGRLVVRSPSPFVARILDLTGLSDFMEVDVGLGV